MTRHYRRQPSPTPLGLMQIIPGSCYGDQNPTGSLSYSIVSRGGGVTPGNGLAYNQPALPASTPGLCRCLRVPPLSTLKRSHCVCVCDEDTPCPCSYDQPAQPRQQRPHVQIANELLGFTQHYRPLQRRRALMVSMNRWTHFDKTLDLLLRLIHFNFAV